LKFWSVYNIALKLIEMHRTVNIIIKLATVLEDTCIGIEGDFGWS